MGAIIVIPARLGAQRLPNKPLAQVGGLPLVAKTALAARGCRRAAEVVVATDAEEIAAAAEAVGVRSVRTSARPANGTERVHEAWRAVGGDVVVNLQVDEPFVDPRDLDLLIQHLEEGGGGWATLARPLTSRAEWLSADVVKVLTTDAGQALYFSRAPLPFQADGGGASASRRPPAGVRAHLGVYGFRAAALEAWARLPRHPLEEAERLEQLRGLAAGMPLSVLAGRTRGISIDTAADLAQARARLRGA